MKRVSPGSVRDRARMGFTLMEIVIAMTLLSVLLVAIFGIVSGTTQLASEAQHQQDSESEAHSFAHLCDRMFRTLSAQSMVRLRVNQSGNHYLSQLAILNPPPVLGPSGNILMTLETEEATSGYMRIVLKTYSSEDIEAMESGDASFSNHAARQRLVLLDNVARCQWAFLSTQSGEWEPLFNEKVNFLQALKNHGVATLPLNTPQLAPPPAPGSMPPSSAGLTPSTGPATQLGNNGPLRPGLIELNLAIGGQPNRRFVFWAPPSSPPGAGIQLVTPTANPLTPVNGLTPIKGPTPAAPTR